MTRTERFHDRVRLDVSLDGSLAWLVMERRSGRTNAFTAPMVDALTDALTAIPDLCRVVVLSGEGEFSVGADLARVAESADGEQPAVIESIATASNGFIRGLRDLDQPTVAAVNGVAAGGGLGFALACDVIVMHEAARLDPAYARVGLTPDNATPYFLALALGPYRAKEWLFRPRAIDAEAAEALGLSARTVEGEPAAFAEAVEAYAMEIARVPVSVNGTTKQLVDTAYTEPLDDHLEREREAIRRAADSSVFTEGLAAFFEKREPEWETDSDGGS